MARAILAEVSSDADARFANAAESLSELADEALKEHHAGKTRPLDPLGTGLTRVSRTRRLSMIRH